MKQGLLGSPIGSKQLICFSLIASALVIPVVWLFDGLFYQSKLGALLWRSIPIAAGILSFVFASATTGANRLRPLAGALIACCVQFVIVLVMTLMSKTDSFLGSFITIYFVSLLWVGWYAALSGFFAAWASAKIVPSVDAKQKIQATNKISGGS